MRIRRRTDYKKLLDDKKKATRLAAVLFLCLVLVVSFLLSRGADTSSLLLMTNSAGASIVPDATKSVVSDPPVGGQPKTNSPASGGSSSLPVLTPGGPDIHGYKRLKMHEIPAEYPPIHCPSLIDDVQQNRTIPDPNHGKVYSRWTDKYPSFQIALHHHSFDLPRWSILEWGHYYETALIQAFTVVLNSTERNLPQLPRVLDVGGNIGYFTLFSAAHGKVIVDSFEPNLVNAFRMCQSIELNGWVNEFQDLPSHNDARINCHPYGVGKEIGSLVFREMQNPGAGKFTQSFNAGGKKVPVVSLDAFAEKRGWFQTNPHIAIFKLDTEGFEINVISGARRLLNSGMVKNIFMEVSARNQGEIDESRICLGIIASAGYDVHQYGGFRGPINPVYWSGENVTEVTDLIIREVTQKKHAQLNLWWRRRPM